MDKNQQNKINLTGADKFILALENHDKYDGTTGNTCRYILDLDGYIELSSIKQLVANNELTNYLSRLSLSGVASNSNHWKVETPREVTVEEFTSDTFIPDPILKIKQNRFDSPLFYFHLLQRSTGKTTVLFSWHHLLMDGYGALLYLQNLCNPIEIKETTVPKSPANVKVFKQLVKAKRYISKSSKGKIATIQETDTQIVKQQLEVLTFNELESSKLFNHTKSYGSKFGHSNYLLASIAKTVQSHFNKSFSENDLWVPVPQDTRKRGSKWPVVGNQLSFIFYRMDHSIVCDKKSTIESLDGLLMEQIKNGIPAAYTHLMNYLRRIPSSVYSRLIKGPSGKALSSFLFTMAAKHPDSFSEFMDVKITNALSIPPNTFPPGLTFAVNQFENSLQIVILSYEHVFPSNEFETFGKSLKNELLDL